MAEQKTLSVDLCHICQFEQIIVLAKKLHIERPLLIIISMLAQVTIQHVATIMISYQQMHAFRIKLLYRDQFLQRSKDTLFMQVITWIRIQVISKADDFRTLG